MSEQERQLRVDPAERRHIRALEARSAPVAVVVQDRAARDQLVRVLADHSFTAHGFHSGQSFLASPDWQLYGCVIAELLTEPTTGLDLQRQLIQDGQFVPFVFLADTANTRATVQAVKYGAVDVLHPPWSSDQLCSSTQEALERWWEASQILSRRREIRKRLHGLTSNEAKVLDMILQGELNKTMANKLQVSIRTIENWRRRLFQKMHTQSVALLVRDVLEGRNNDPPAVVGISSAVAGLTGPEPHLAVTAAEAIATPRQPRAAAEQGGNPPET